jgi:dipeptidyl-peptidase-4
LREAQAAVAERPEFKDDVVFVPTRAFVRKAADSPNPGHGHHEFGNAETYFLVGDALGKVALQMAGRDRQVRQVRGWTLRIDERLIAKDAAVVEKAVGLLDAQLAKVERLVPAKAVERLRAVPLNFSLPYPGVRPTAEYHGGLAWVKQAGREIALAKAVEFTDIDRFEPEIRRMPVFVLHELAHAYHDQVVPGGYENPDILAAFRQAKAAGGYDAVKRWTGDKFADNPSKAYAMTNQMEYFAETSEAYFERNDMEPFDLAELKAKDPAVIPVLEKIWGVR